MRCCGEEVETPFCPMCGSTGVKGHGIDGLLHYLKSNLKSSKRYEARTIKWAKDATGVASDSHKEQRLQKRRRVVLKWESWLGALERMIDELNSHGDRPA